jgi:hypothetical protein
MHFPECRPPKSIGRENLSATTRLGFLSTDARHAQKRCMLILKIKRSFDIKVISTLRQSLQQERMADVEIVTAGSGAKKLDEKLQLVAIPLLNVVAVSHGEKGDDRLALHDAPADSMIAAPKEWRHNPSSPCCLRVRGRSMEPTMCDGDIVAFDSSQRDMSKLNGKIVIAWSKVRD